MFGNIDVILLSNSYWLGEDVPCLTYGLRGVIHASIEISSSRPDLHSGVEGGAVSEPLIDMIKILASLVGDDGKVLIPGFYDKLRAVTPAEEKFYDPIIEWLESQKPSTPPSSPPSSSIWANALLNREKDLKRSLMARWRYPTLTVHKIDVSHNNNTIIPRRAQAAVSMRVVPDQEIRDIREQFEGHVQEVFGKLKTDNIITVNIRNTADWWLGDPDTEYFKAAEKVIEELCSFFITLWLSRTYLFYTYLIKQEWGVKPLYIREGGSIPAVRWLERFFDAVAVHLPMGQASDQAHLNNERIRLRNLHAGRRIVKSLLRELSTRDGKRVSVGAGVSPSAEGSN
ncbi:hypothetical protein BC936DRAFT_147132 [Jimgerdemannia flammicorona]|uniref:Peptidase M20 dimerisation domain-containing protein n=1 Tax=Jimgerdemannia flammicorona TaxID=994334 RepID=A0A433D602_9FUNG|nr:hypothetical protein BC936DRAFT_147132 [Jimgerdemannia flammicorona]